MKAYLIISGSIFGLVVVAHALRLLQEGIGPTAEPIFVVSTVVSAVLCCWALSLLRSRSPRQNNPSDEPRI